MKRIVKLLSLSSGLLIIIAFFTVIVSSPTHAASWDAGRIIDDVVFTNNHSMNAGDIQNFLNSKVPTCDTNHTRTGSANDPGPPYICLKNYSENGRSAAQIIYDTAQTYRINPQVFIVLLQKEQGLVTDTWPWPIQYKTATGYGCPDTAPCDSQYYGLTNQLDWSGKMFRAIEDGSPTWYTPYVVGNNFIQYNPQSSCGGSNVNIQNRATQALYNYTPYQPNQAALDAGYGSAPPCGAYGNRNFWLYFNDWFGPTLNTSFTIAIGDNGSPNQYLLFGGLKQAIPDPETKIAWGIQSIPITTISAAYLASLPNGPYLDRLTRLNTSDNTVFFMDGGKRYRVMSQPMFDAWNFSGRPITNVPPGLFYIPSDGGELKFSVKDPSTTSAFMVDGGSSGGQTILRPYQSDTVRKAWEGETDYPINLSSNFFGQINNAIGSTLTTTKAVYSGNEYQILGGQKLPQPSHIAPLYPGVAQTISSATYLRLGLGSPIAHLVRSNIGPEVYLIDNGTKHHILSPDVLTAWSIVNAPIIVANISYLDNIPTGTSLNSYTADSGGQLYIVDQAKMTIPTSLDAAYRNSGTAFAATPSLTSLFRTTPNQATGIIKSRSSPSAYLLDNSGKKRLLEWADKLTAWGGQQASALQLSDYIVNSIAAGPSPGLFVTDGTSNYAIDNGQKWPVTTNIATDWGLSNSQPFTDGTLTRLAAAAPLANKIQDGRGGFYLIRGGTAYGTADANIAEAWSINDGQVHNTGIISGLIRAFTLTRFVKSSVDSRTFIIDKGIWYNLSAAQRSNLGSANEPTMTLNPTYAPSTITDWTSVVVRSANGTPYVIDGGGKRYFINQQPYDQWTNYSNLPMPAVSNGFLNLLPTRGWIERAIKGSGPAVYSAENGIKRHIQYPDVYNRYYAPFMPVSDQLLEAMPTGSPI